MMFPLVGLHVSTYLLGVAAVFVATMDPTVKVAVIAATPSALTGIGYLVLRYFDVQESKRQFNVLHELSTTIEKHTDGINSSLRDSLFKQTEDLAASNQALERSRGRREGREAAEERFDRQEDRDFARRTETGSRGVEEDVTGTTDKNKPPTAKAIGAAVADALAVPLPVSFPDENKKEQ